MSHQQSNPLATCGTLFGAASVIGCAILVFAWASHTFGVSNYEYEYRMTDLGRSIHRNVSIYYFAGAISAAFFAFVSFSISSILRSMHELTLTSAATFRTAKKAMPDPTARPQKSEELRPLKRPPDYDYGRSGGT
jgi:hypothetical protein